MSAARALALLLVLAAGCAGRPQPVDRLGARELAWTLRPLDQDTTVTLGSLRQRVLVLNLWATWCVPCVAELASFERLRASVAGEDIAFAFVTYEPAGRVRTFADRYGVNLPLYLEVERAPDELGVRALPTTLVIDAAGHVVLRRRGAAAWDTPAFADMLRRLARP